MPEETEGKQMEQMFKLLSKLRADEQVQLMESLKTFAVELRKPTEAEQAKLDKEKADLAQKVRNRIALAKAEEESKQMRKNGCGHQMPNGRHTFRGQVNSDGFIRPLCTICLTEFPPLKATQDQISNGVNFEAYRTLDMAMLEKWSVLTNKTA